MAYGQAISSSLIGNDATSMAMGGSSMASSAPYTIFNNISLLPFHKDDAGAGLSLTDWGTPGWMNYSAATSMMVGGRFGFGIGASYGSGAEYDIISGNGAPSGTFKPAGMKAGAGATFLITDGISAGASLFFLNEELAAGQSYSTMAADLAVTASVSDGLRLSAGAKAIGGKVKSADGDSFNIPSSIFAGALWCAGLGESGTVEAAGDFNYFLDGGIKAALGGQYTWKDMISIRAGFNTSGSNAQSFMTAGAGIRFMGAALDLAYMKGLTSLKSSNIIVGLSYVF